MAHLLIEKDSLSVNQRTYELEQNGRIHDNLSPAALIEHAIRRGEGELEQNGAFVVRTGKFTGRSPKDKYLVEEAGSRDAVWWGPVNQPLSEESFARLERRIREYLSRREIYAQSLYGGADARYALPVRVVS